MLHYGLDIHTKYTSYCAVDDRGQVIAEGRVPNERQAFAELFPRHPGRRRAAMEACLSWPLVYDLVFDLVDELQLAHPLATKYVAWNKVKTDRLDARALATLLRGDLIPQAYLAPPDIRRARMLVRHRLTLVTNRARFKNSIHSLLLRAGHQRQASDVFGRRGRQWLSQLPLARLERRLLERNLAALDRLSELIDQTDQDILSYFSAHPAFALLQTIPGVGPTIAAIFIAELGCIQRFPSAKQVVAYAGLVPSEHSSGGKVRRGGITGLGSVVLRWAAVEAAIWFERAVPQARVRGQRLRESRGQEP